MHGEGDVNGAASAFGGRAGVCTGQTGCGRPCMQRLACSRAACGGRTSCGRACADKGPCDRVCFTGVGGDDNGGRMHAGARSGAGAGVGLGAEASGVHGKSATEITQNGLKKLRLGQVDEVLVYDGSLPGLYCCVYHAVYGKAMPVDIVAEHAAEPTLFAMRPVPTEEDKARRVRASISGKISPRALELVETVFLTCCEQKELAILNFLLLGYAQGAKTPYLFGHRDVEPLLKAEKHLTGETHLLKGFVRFSDCDGVLTAQISPKNFVLPFLAEHFVDRYPNENFLIFDKTNKAALIYENRTVRVVPLDGIDFPEADEAEENYRALWRQFYKTIAIKERENPRCRRTHMPKRYWENMTEMQEYL